jgi:hypothetical protein
MGSTWFWVSLLPSASSCHAFGLAPLLLLGLDLESAPILLGQAKEMFGFRMSF